MIKYSSILYIKVLIIGATYITLTKVGRPSNIDLSR